MASKSLFLVLFSFYVVSASAQAFVESQDTVVYGGYSIPAGFSTNLCASYLANVQGQCNPPSVTLSESLCAADRNCGGVTCHSDDTVCTLRYLPLTTPSASSNYNWYAKPSVNVTQFYFSAYPSTVISGSFLIPSGSSTTLCAAFSSSGQCIPPNLEAAQALCALDGNCGGVNCHSDDTVCTLRYTPLTTLTANSAYNAFVKSS